MGDECTESSVATSSTPPNWWDSHNHNHHHHGSPSLSSYSSHWPHQNPNSNTSCDQDVSLSTSSFHSALTVESSRRLFDPLPSDNQLWTQVLLNIGNGVELQSDEQEIGENFLEAISSKNISTTGIFESAACSDYLKKMDTNYNNNWNSFPIFDANNNNNNNNGLITTHSHAAENERLLKLSSLVNTWSIALPMDDEPDHLRAATVPCFGHGLKAEAPEAGTVAPIRLEPGAALFRRSFGSGGFQNSIGAKQYDHSMQLDNAGTRNFADYISFNGRLGKPVININGINNPCFKSLNLSADTKKQIHQTSSPTRISGRGSGVSSEGKKKRSEECSETATKKTKQENATAASNKMQQPKVKLGDRITALQQIVSPFGKTDTASVLTETIGYIKFLQEQIQDPWKSTERKDPKGDGKIDLRSRGLCLVPISCTPQVYRENTGSDYWTPYRGCFYR
ncbi:transcription factor bHLH111 isoform X2 [Momordica charantia]|uniref:Transcription factor bHLH111 isoform X2 n=1 Tax=Momordica charantia TaxID=3673 RepID=A0A6J1E2A3_MOMCH|nr:transcription factor bHLH111 isoform X2 [Momordica charantia]